MNEFFRHLAHRSALIVGSPWAFVTSVLLVIVWALAGPYYGYSDTWQLVVNTGTTVLTFLMIFLVQNTQNRDGRAIQLKLDELIRASKSSRNQLINLEDFSDEEMEKIHQQFRELHEQARRKKERN